MSFTSCTFAANTACTSSENLLRSFISGYRLRWSGICLRRHGVIHGLHFHWEHCIMYFDGIQSDSALTGVCVDRAGAVYASGTVLFTNCTFLTNSAPCTNILISHY